MLSRIARGWPRRKHARKNALSNSRETAKLRAALLAWYDRTGRTLPWRVRPEDRSAGRSADPYAVWLSEIMLQQTTAPHAAPFWERFLARWPGVGDLAAAPRGDVLAAWAGLGYYARARNLHKCAQVVADDLGGVFPSDLEALRALPGIGEYTSNAIRAIAFDEPASVVDGNVERVISRLDRIETPLPKSKPAIKARASELADPERPGDYAQALMDLGATVCTPRSPDCAACPWAFACAARTHGDQTRYPLKEKKKPKPVRAGVCFHVVKDGALWLRRRPETGLLGAMMELPGTDWTVKGPEADDIDAATPFSAAWRAAGEVRHVFTHFELRLSVRCAAAPADWTPPAGVWAPIDALSEAGLPSVMMKAARLGLEARSRLL
ncbi:A/G-specific adenine glycosylase [Maricaulaceae bacterium MS644]